MLLDYQTCWAMVDSDEGLEEITTPNIFAL